MVLNNIFGKPITHDVKYEKMFVQCFNEIYKICKEKGISMRMASYVKALKRIELAIKVRGWV